MSVVNYSIFEKDSHYWRVLTNNGEREVPDHVKSIVKNGDIVIETKKHPIRPLEEGKWLVNYSESI